MKSVEESSWGLLGALKGRLGSRDVLHVALELVTPVVLGCVGEEANSIGDWRRPVI